MEILLIRTINWFFRFLYFMILIRIILSWFPVNKSSRPYRFLADITDPILEPIRKLVRKSPLGGPGMMLDFSPIIATFLLTIVENLLITLVKAIF